VEESKQVDEAMPAFVGAGQRRQQVTLEMLFELVMDLKTEIRELRAAMQDKPTGAASS